MRLCLGITHITTSSKITNFLGSQGTWHWAFSCTSYGGPRGAIACSQSLRMKSTTTVGRVPRLASV